MHSFSEIILKWPGLTDFARDMDVPVTTAQSWRDRDSIPNARWRKLIERARARGIKGVSYSSLGQLEPGAQANKQRVA